MKIYSVLVDKKPKMCLLCPLFGQYCKNGVEHTWESEPGWQTTAIVPGEKCLLKVKE